MGAARTGGWNGGCGEKGARKAPSESRLNHSGQGGDIQRMPTSRAGKWQGEDTAEAGGGMDINKGAGE